MSDEAASFPIEQLLREDGRSLRALARALLHDEHAAADVVQEAALAALASATNPGGPAVPIERPGGWLRTLVRNFARKRRRGDERRSAREAAVSDAVPLPSPLELATRGELTRRLVEAVLALDEPYHATILLRYFHDLSAATIARREGVAESTVRVRSMRALEQLRARLDAKHAGGRGEWLAAVAPLAAGFTTRSAALVAGGGVALMSTAKVAWISAVAAVVGLVSWSVLTEPQRRPRQFDLATIVAATPEGIGGEPATRTSEPVALPPGAATVTGRVVDEAGAAIANATIVWAEQVVVAGERRPELNADLRSGDDGRFAITGLHEGAELMVEAGMPRRVPAETKGFARVVDGLELPPFVLARGTILEGVVVDLAGAPVAGARVLASRRLVEGFGLPELPPPHHPGIEVGEVQEATTDAAGEFRLEGLRPDDSPLPARRGRVGVVVEHAEFASRCELAPADAPLEIVLGPRPEVVVSVSGAGPGALAASVVVDAFSPLVPDSARGALRDGRQVLAASLGAGATATARPEFSPVLLRARAEVAGRPRVETFVRVEPGATAAIELVIPADAADELRGRVVDAATGAPIAGARVSLPTPESVRQSLLKEIDAPARATTGDDGGFRLPVAGGWAAPRVQCDGYAPAQAPWIELALQREPIEIALARGANLKLVVRDGDGDAWDGRCRVILQSRHLELLDLRGSAARHDSAQWFGGGAQAAVDDRNLGRDGTLDWKSLPPGEYRVALYFAPSFFDPASRWCGPDEAQFVLREGETRELELRATPDAERAELAGTLLVNHAPVEGLKLSVVDPVDHANLGPAGGDFELDDDGDFELEVPAGRRLLLVLRDPRRGGFSGEVGAIGPLRGGESRTLALDVAWALLQGRVIDAMTGRPIEGARIGVVRGAAPALDAGGRASLPPPASLGLPAIGWPPTLPRSSADGGFVAGLWPAGPCHLLVSCAGYAPAMVDASFTERAPASFEIALAPAGNELLIDAPPAPPDSANPHLDPWQVTVRAAAIETLLGHPQPFLADVTMEADRIVVRDLPAGALTLVVGAYDWPGRGVVKPAAARLALDMPASGRVDAAIDPPAGGDLSVLLCASDGSLALDGEVVALDGAGAPLPRIDWNGRWVSDVDPAVLAPPSGRHLLAQLPAGPVRLRARFRDGATAESDATVVAGRTTSIEIRRR